MAVNKIFIPTFISSVDYQPVRTLPHIYFYNGLKECEPYYIEHYTNTTGSVTASVQNSFPYVDNYDGLIPTTGSRSLLFYNESTPYGDTPTASLYTTYWDKYVSLLYNPKTRLINCSAIIPLADYFQMELNDIVQWRGNYYHLRAINDYNLKNGTCNLQLLGPIISDAVTPPTADCTFNFSSSFAGLIASGGQEITTYISGSYLWKSHIFTNAGTSSFTVASGSTNIAKILVVGSGGSEGSRNGTSGPLQTPGSGGGGGTIEYKNQTLNSGSYIVTVGDLVTDPANGSNLDGYNGNSSSFSGSGINLSVLGGGGGGQVKITSPTSSTAGLTGGSGGGGGALSNSGSGTSPQGFDGGFGYAPNSVNKFGGPGGGSGEKGNSGGIRGYGGNGKQVPLYYGVNAFYGGGGAGYSDQGWSGNQGIPGFGVYGQGSGIYRDSSQKGIVIISYPFQEINPNITELVRFTPGITSGTLEYIEGGTGLLKQVNFSSSANITRCVVSGSQWNFYTIKKDLGLSDAITTSFPSVNQGGTRTVLSGSC